MGRVLNEYILCEARVVPETLLTFRRLLRNEPLSGNFKPSDKPIWQIDLSFISENQKNESLGEKGMGVNMSAKRKGQSLELAPCSMIECPLDGPAGFLVP